MIYCDTSVLVAALTVEQHTDEVTAWLAGCVAGSLAVSAWTHTEIASALAMKVRTRHLSVEQRRRAWLSWHSLYEASFLSFSIRPVHFVLATELLDRDILALRAGDALHLAVAQEHGASIATLDQRMAGAAILAEITVERVPQQA